MRLTEKHRADFRSWLGGANGWPNPSGVIETMGVTLRRHIINGIAVVEMRRFDLDAPQRTLAATLRRCGAAIVIDASKFDSPVHSLNGSDMIAAMISKGAHDAAVWRALRRLVRLTGYDLVSIPPKPPRDCASLWEDATRAARAEAVEAAVALAERWLRDASKVTLAVRDAFRTVDNSEHPRRDAIVALAAAHDDIVLKRWKAGEPLSPRLLHDPWDHVRESLDGVETTRGMCVNRLSAKRIVDAIRAGKRGLTVAYRPAPWADAKTTRASIGDGIFVAGCHDIRVREILDLAEKMHLTETT